MPLCPSDGEILTEACEVFHGFLAWPEPYCSVCRNLLSTLHQENRAPGSAFTSIMQLNTLLNTSFISFVPIYSFIVGLLKRKVQ